MTAPARQAAWRLTRKPAQCLARPTRPKPTFRQRLGAHCHFAELVGFIGQRRLAVAAPFLLKPHHLRVRALLTRNLCAAKEVEFEQKVIGRAPLGWRRQRRQAGLPDVFRPARTE